MDWRLHCGRAQDILPGDYEGQVQLVLSSPPYDGLRTYGGAQDAWDFNAVADVIVPCLADGGVLVWIVGDQIHRGSESGTSMQQALAFMERGLRLHQTLIYERTHPTPTTDDRCLKNWQYMFVLSNGRPATADIPRDRLNVTVGKTRGNHGAGRHKDGRIKTRTKHVGLTQESGKRSSIWRYTTGLHHMGGPVDSNNLCLLYTSPSPRD